MIKLYTDGSFRNDQGDSICGSGYVIVDDGNIVIRKGMSSTAHPVWAEMHNVGGEICAVIDGIGLCIQEGIKEVVVVHDYEGVSKWVTGEWECHREGTKIYREFMRSCKNDIYVTYEKVKAHSGDRWNNEADRLAKESIGL